MTSVYWDEINEELRLGASQKGHAFRNFTLGTVGLDTVARLRTVVLREVSQDLDLFFYTDQRSKKVIHIKENHKVSLLFYNPDKRLQLRIEGMAKLDLKMDEFQTYWDKLTEEGKKDYTTSGIPGTVLQDPADIEYLKEGHHFCRVRVKPYRIEYLKLQSPDHIRIGFSREDDIWKGDFLVP